jgi:hypothetical protein
LGISKIPCHLRRNQNILVGGSVLISSKIVLLCSAFFISLLFISGFTYPDFSQSKQKSYTRSEFLSAPEQIVIDELPYSLKGKLEIHRTPGIGDSAICSFHLLPENDNLLLYPILDVQHLWLFYGNLSWDTSHFKRYSRYPNAQSYLIINNTRIMEFVYPLLTQRSINKDLSTLNMVVLLKTLYQTETLLQAINQTIDIIY